MEEWKVIQLKEVCELIPGFAFKSSEFGEHEYSAIKIGDIRPPYVHEEGLTGVDISRYSKEKLEKFKVYYGDFVLAMTGATIGKIGRYIGTSGAYINQRVLLFRPKENVNKEYIYYCLQTPVFQQYIFNHIDSQTAQPNISAGSVSGFEILLPCISIQNKIADILSALDSKIELNNRINHNLEEQAQAIYKSWSVDFEPFKNGKFIESELGLIPEGWKIGKINDVINLLSGFPFKSSDFQENGDYQLITIKGVQDGYLDVTSADMLSYLPKKMPQYCILNIGDILISLTGNVGRICIVDRNNLLLNQRVAILSPKNIRDSFYVYTMFRSESMKNELIHLARGTAQLNLSPIETGEKLTVIPPDSILEAFAKVGKGTFNQYISLKMENIRLMEMRDALLPKLMSGDLKLNEIDC